MKILFESTAQNVKHAVIELAGIQTAYKVQGGFLRGHDAKRLVFTQTDFLVHHYCSSHGNKARKKMVSPI